VGISRFGDSITTNVSSYAEVSGLINNYRPDFVFHFAANSTTDHSAWQENHEAIGTGTLNILEAVREFSPSASVFVTGSGLQFQNHNKPIKESDPFEGNSIYAVSRIHSTYAARYYRTLGVNAYVGYLFNHDSPLRSNEHINKKVVDAAMRIARGSKEKLVIGDLSVKKEFGFAGDIVKAIWTLVNQHSVWEATIGTGKAYAIEEWVDLCFSLCGLHWKDHVQHAENFARQYDILVSDPTTIFSLGWHPEISIEELAKMMMS
jgi:GDPmannose 4,6-dehydratase